MKFISWNVNGLRACMKPKTDDDGKVISKGFEAYFKDLDADFFCLQETYADKKGYSGTAIFARQEPLSVAYGMGIDDHDHEGRVITLEYADFYLVCVYTPNSQDGLRRLDYRMKWEDDFRNFLLTLNDKKPVIVCGDMNVAHEEIDIKNPTRSVRR